MKIHELKTDRQVFNLTIRGVKNYEVRLNDRDFKVGDKLRLKEWDPVQKIYTGRTVTRNVDHILFGGQYGISPDYVVMSISKGKLSRIDI